VVSCAAVLCSAVLATRKEGHLGNAFPDSLLLQGREKINLIYRFTSMGFNILVSDVDTVWMKNPLTFVARYPTADVLSSSDHLVGG
jgi:Nucleotide-diphospho-sugar transferase